MYKNVVKKMLQEKQPVLGCIVNGPYPALVELLGLAGFHFVFIDAEHGSLSVSECEELVRAAEVRRIVPLIRTPENNPKQILRYLEIGAMGIIIPEVNSRAEAEAAVQAVKYAPLGRRGLATMRCADFGYGKSKAEYLQEANDETLVIVLVESKPAVEQAEEILSVEGVDAFMIGTSDLSMSLGVQGQVDHPLVVEAYHRVLSLGKALDKPIGIIVRDGESPRKYFDQGISFAYTNLTALIKSSAREFINQGASSYSRSPE
jgi:4-hydroxy-2-oxoheptanedioate aldolase